MLKRVFIAAILVLALMIAIKDGRLLRSTGLIASCGVVSTAADGTQTEACRPGRLEGAHNLSAQGCTFTGNAGPDAYWRCPAPVVSSQVGR